MMTRKRILRWLLLGVVAVFLTMTFMGLMAPNVVRAYMVRWSNLTQVAPKVYVDPNMTPAMQIGFMDALERAKGRVAGLYGEYTANPTIVAGQDMQVMKDYGGNSYNRAGRTLSTAVETFIILGPYGIRKVDILAHELAHAEFFKRLGYRNRNQVPNWFDEGLAVQVDDRVSLEQWRWSTDDGRTAPELSQIGIILEKLVLNSELSS